MIHLSFCVSNPWGHNFQTLWNKTGDLTQHKSWEVEIYRSDIVIEAEFKAKIREDHSGITVSLGLLSYTVRAQLYDTRHWDSKNNCYGVEE